MMSWSVPWDTNKLSRAFRTIWCRDGLLLVGALVTLWAYYPGVKGGFYLDDGPNIVESQAVQIERISWDGVWGVLTGASIPSRLIANLTFALNHRLGGLEPRGYHLFNLLIHLAMGLVLVWVWRLLVTEGDKRLVSERQVPLLLTSLVGLFWLHPINIQAVSYVVQRMSSLCALFFWLSLGCYLAARRGGSRALYVASLLAGLLALGSKENALVLPVAIVLYELCYHLTAWRVRLARLPRPWKVLGISSAVVLLLPAMLIAYLHLPRGDRLFGGLLRWSSVFPRQGYSGAQRVLTQARVQLFYLGLLLWPAPSRLNTEHDFQVSRSLLDPWTTLPALFFWIAVAVGGVMLCRRRPRLGFPILLYLLAHLPEAGPVDLALVFEHRMYLPSGALLLLLAGLVVEQRWVSPRWIVLIVALWIPLGIASYQRNQTWADPLTLHRDAAAKSPHKFRPQYNLGTLLGKRGELNEAIAALRRALRSKPRHAMARNQLGNCLLLAGRPDLAHPEYRQSVELDGENAEARYNLGRSFDKRGERRLAIEHYRWFVDNAPELFAPQRRWVKQRLLELSSKAPSALQ